MHVRMYLVMFKLPTLFYYTIVMSLNKIIYKLTTAVSVSWQFCLEMSSVYTVVGKLEFGGGGGKGNHLRSKISNVRTINQYKLVNGASYVICNAGGP